MPTLVRTRGALVPYVTPRGVANLDDGEVFGDRDAAHPFGSKEAAERWIARQDTTLTLWTEEA